MADLGRVARLGVAALRFPGRSVMGWLRRRFAIDEMVQELQETYEWQLPVSHTERYQLSSIWYWYPFYMLGYLAFILFIVLAITGFYIGLYYKPSTELVDGEPLAYNSIKVMMVEVPFGYMMRALHHWSAHMMVAAVSLHMFRVYFTGAYRKPRELNWILGLILLGITLFFGYSGYLLPWNELGWLAGTVGLELTTTTPYIGEDLAKIVFGSTVLGPEALTRMYFFHVFLLPIVGVSLMVLHIVVVWIQGMAEPH